MKVLYGKVRAAAREAPAAAAAASWTIKKYTGEVPRGNSFDSITAEIRREIEAAPRRGWTAATRCAGRDIVLYCHGGAAAGPDWTLLEQLWFGMTLFNVPDLAHCSPTLNIYIYPTAAKKRLPAAVGAPIGRDHVNSAFSYPCVRRRGGGEIYIFRREELFKVLLHEIIHAVGVSYHDRTTERAAIARLFGGIPTKYLYLFEAYTEFLAEIVHTMYISPSWQQFGARLRREQQHAIQQSNRILAHFGLTYSELINHGGAPRGAAWKEETAAFAYYVLRAILLWGAEEFLAGGGAGVVSPQKKLLEFVVRNYKAAELVAAFDGAPPRRGESLRMTYYG